MTIEGIIEKIIYKNPENGYSVVELSQNDETIIIVGILPLVAEGEQIQVEGEYITHPSYGRQFSVTSFTSRLPVAESAILKYLSSGIVRGIREKTAKTLIENFGPETLDVIENSPERVAKIKGITKIKAEMMATCMRETLGVKSVLLYFQQFGINPSVAFKVYKQWGMRSYDLLKQNPYRLCEIDGITFETADTIAEKMDYDKNSKNRIQAAIIYLLNYNLYSGGHTFLPKDKLINIACNMLGIEYETALENIEEMIGDEVLVWKKRIGNTDGVYLQYIYEEERSITQRILGSAKFNSDYDGDFNRDIDKIQENLNIAFAEKQRNAIKEACCHQMMILTGGPGTGKTTTLRGIITAFEMRGISFALAAPTGRAAKRMTELTGKEAKTIHRLLEYKPQGEDYKFGRNKENQLDFNAIILDESSMIDINLFYSLLDALPYASKLILVGDVAQLPPIGPGKIFKDIIDSGLITIIELNEIFRQAKESLIVTNAHKILNGEEPIMNERKKDFFFMKAETTLELAQTISELYSKRLPAAYGYNPLTDIQVLSPSRRTSSGTNSLNNALRQTLNPPSPKKRELTFRGSIFREGDKVMQIKNNYDIIADKDNGDSETGVYNGDIGTVDEVDYRKEYIVVRFDDKKIIYTIEMLDELEPAYAITVHKSQGSEFDAVILSILDGADILFTRNLLYTAVTRAKKILIVVGSAERVRQMVRNVKSDKRYSGLKFQLLDAVENTDLPPIIV